MKPLAARSFASISFAIAFLAPLLSERPGGAVADPAQPACDVAEVEYTLAATLHLSDTPLGKGDGTYAIGPGSVVIRFDRLSGRAQMLAYHMTEHFTIQTTALLWTTTVLTDTHTHATPDHCSVAATGTLTGRTLRWSSPVSGYATDGTLTCDGTLCGKFGAPPPGRSDLHIAPHPVTFSQLDFSPDGKTFTMASTFVSKTDAPKQTGYLALAGREVKRTCVQAPTCK